MKKPNALVADTAQALADLEGLVRSVTGRVFDNAAQIWNHNFYWRSMKPDGGGSPDEHLLAAIRSEFGSLRTFRDAFVSTGEGFSARAGSGSAGRVNACASIRPPTQIARCDTARPPCSTPVSGSTATTSTTW